VGLLSKIMELVNLFGERTNLPQNKNAERLRKWREKNRERARELDRKYRIKNREKLKIKSKKWREKNKKRCREYHAKYKKRNPKKFKKYRKKYRKRHPEVRRRYQKKRRKENPKYHLNGNISKAIGASLSGKKHGRKWEILVGYTCQNLMKHLEKQFDEKMSWGNYGNYWVIDHIRPISSFNFTSPDDLEFKQCWALENLQPLEKIENIKKSNNYTPY